MNSFPTIDAFTPRIGETFRAIVDDEWEIHLRLSTVTPWGNGAVATPGRVPYALLFHAPVEALVSQRIFRIEHEAMAPFEMFLVPVGPDERGMRYEAIVS